MDLLGDSDTDNDVSASLTINRKYAQSYEKWRKKEERQKLIDKYGEDQDTESSSEEEEEIRSTPQMDKDWLRAYSIVRFNQPRLYTGENLFHEEIKPTGKKNEKIETLKDYERRFILEKGGVESDDDSEEEKMQKMGKSYFEEQEEIKDSFKDALIDSDSDADDEKNKDSLLMKKIKTQAERRKEENEYLEWLKGEREELEDAQAAEELAPLKAYWNDPNLTDKEKVLRDYILNNGYMDREGSDEDSDSDEGPDHEEEEEFLEKAEEYEQKYNFRHEEPGGSEIKSYPRMIETSVRVKDSRRAEKRHRRMEKKQQEQKQKQEEIRLLQKLQREEKEEKLSKLREISKNPELTYDLEGDFDPEEHNKIMEKYFNDDYYGEHAPGKKPVFEYDEAIDDDCDDWWSKRNQEQMQEDGTQGDEPNNDNVEEEFYDEKFIMDADYDDSIDYKSKKKKEKKKKKKKGKATTKKSAIDPSSKSFDEFVGEYLKDKIPTIPFPYREVVPNNFGLSTEEILMAPDRELNAWVSVKKMSLYRSGYEERQDIQKFSTKAQNLHSKYKKLPSLFSEPGDEEVVKSKKKKKKRKTKKEQDTADVDEPMKEEENGSSFINSDITENKNSSGTKRKASLEKDLVLGKIKKSKTDEENITIERKGNKRKTEKSISDSAFASLAVKKNSSDTQINPGSREKKMKKTISGNRVQKTQNEVRKNNPEDSKIKCKSKNIKKQSSTKPSSGIEKRPISETENKKTLSLKDSEESSVKKRKKKKPKLHLDHSSTTAGQKEKSVNKKTRKEDLKKVMSAYRLSKYGIGPSVVKDASQTKKKKKKKKKATISK